MNKIIGNLLVSVFGRIVFTVILLLVTQALTWAASKILWLAPVFESVSPPEVATAITGVVLLWLLSKVHAVTGDAVRPVQRWLQSLGYNIEDDGWFYDKSALALHKETGAPVRKAVAVEPPDPWHGGETNHP